MRLPAKSTASTSATRMSTPVKLNAPTRTSATVISSVAGSVSSTMSGVTGCCTNPYYYTPPAAPSVPRALRDRGAGLREAGPPDGLPASGKLDTVGNVDHEPSPTDPGGRAASAGPAGAGGSAARGAETPRPPPGRARGARPRVGWQTVTRTAIAAGLVIFTTMLVTGLRERRDSMEARGVDRADPEAVIESAGIEFVRSDGRVVIFRLVAARQSTYSDGSIRFFGGVTLTAPERAGRAGFTMTASEAFVEAGQSDFTVSGEVRMGDADGLVAHTGTAGYSEARNVVTMRDPAGPTKLVRAGLEAAGNDVAQDRDRGVVTLDGDARVRLTGDADRAAVEIAAPHATLADADRYMRFEGGTSIRTGEMTVASDSATAYFGEGETALESIELDGDVRIRSTAAADGGLRESRAEETVLRFEPATRQLRQVVLAGQATVELAGADGGEGSRIESEAMEVELAPSRSEVVGLTAGGGMRLRLPVTPGEPRQEIRAGRLTAAGTAETGLNGISLDGGVDYLERHEATENGAASTRTVLADRLEAGVGRGLVGLFEVQFDGGVRFEDESRRAEAARAAYDLLGGTISLSSDADGGQRPTLVDGNRTIEAGERLEVGLDRSRVSGSGGVQTVLTPPENGEGDPGADKVPALLDPTQRINILADTVDYDDDARQVTYDGEARMWQGATSFEGGAVAIDHATGGLSVTGSVRTTIQLVRIDEEAEGGNVVSRTDARAESFLYDDAARHAIYEGAAVLRSDYGDLGADAIEVFLQADGRTLDRLTAAESVQLRLDRRWAAGDTLVYHEGDGRYDMEGAPVEIVEEAEPEEPEEPAATEPAEPVCRSTRGRVLTFYRGSDVVSVDGRDQSRTETSTGSCQPPQF